MCLCCRMADCLRVCEDRREEPACEVLDQAGLLAWLCEDFKAAHKTQPALIEQV